MFPRYSTYTIDTRVGVRVVVEELIYINKGDVIRGAFREYIVLPAEPYV